MNNPISSITSNVNGDEFDAAGLRFQYVRGSDPNLLRTTKEKIIVLKPLHFFRNYVPIFASMPNKNVLEFGVFEGGSIIFFALAFPKCRFVGIDIRAPSEFVLQHIHDLDLQDRVKIYYNTSQSDKDKVSNIIATEFGDESLGIVIDDASHDYYHSRRTFELTFGRLAPRGTYCLEDWGWAHRSKMPQTQRWADQPALTNLVFEVLMLCASTHNLIDGLQAKPGLACFRRGKGKLEELQINSLIHLRNKALTLI